MSILTPGSTRCRHVVSAMVLVLAATMSAGAAKGRGHDPEKLSGKARKEGKAKGEASLDVIVRFRKDPGAREKELVKGFGGKVRRQHRSRWMTVRVPGRALEQLANDDAVEFVAMDVPMAATMDVAVVAADLPGAERPESALMGAGVTIAMLDSGVAALPQIQTLVAAVDFAGLYDPTFAPASSVDPNGHGTHVAGIMVGKGCDSNHGSYGSLPNGGNGSQLIQRGRCAGVAPEASLVSVRVLDDQGRGQASGMLAGLDWVLAHKDEYGIRVLNLSLGHPVYEDPAVDPLVQAVDALWDAGVVVVCSAGNNGRNGHGTITSPCNSRKVITVGALNDRNTVGTADDSVTTYSSRGPTRINLVAKPDLMAPGNRIVSLRAPGSHLDLAFPERRVAGDPSHPNVIQYFEMSGTSMAAPIVAGAAALMLEQEPSLNPGTVKARLMLSARKAAVGDPFATGAGALDILAALHSTEQVVDAPSPRVFADSSSSQLSFENTGVLWSNPGLSLSALWGSAVLWSNNTPLDAAVVSSSGVVLPDTNANALLWPDSTLWSEALLWPNCTLWSEAVLWPDAAAEIPIEPLGVLVDDP